MTSIIKYIALGCMTIALVFSAACKSRKKASEEIVVTPTQTEVVRKDTLPSVFLKYSRTPCFGRCPSFDLLVYSDGKVLYTGKNNVNWIGDYQGKWPQSVLNEIRKVATGINYADMQNVYDREGVTDLPSIITELDLGNGLKYVKNRIQGPKELGQLYAIIDRQIEITDWKAVEALNIENNK